MGNASSLTPVAFEPSTLPSACTGPGTGTESAEPQTKHSSSFAPSRHGSSFVKGMEGKGTTSGNAFVDAMNRLSLEKGRVRTENGAPALGTADLVDSAPSPLEGLLVSYNTSSIGSRGSSTRGSLSIRGRRGRGRGGSIRGGSSFGGGKTAKTGLSRDQLETFVDDYLRTVTSQTKSKPEEASFFLATFFIHLAYTRDIRDGKGERDLAYWTILRTWLFYPQTVMALLPMLTWETYGSFKDLNRILELCAASTEEKHKDLARFVEGMWVEALSKDKACLSEGKTSGFSLAAKWAPRQDSYTAKACPDLVFRLAWYLGDSHESPRLPCPLYDKSSPAHRSLLKAYRILCSTLNGHLKTVEVAMCGKAWKTIDPTHVPGRCHTMRREALMNRRKGEIRSTDPDRVACAAKFEALYEEVKKNPKKAAAKGLIKTKTLTPLELVAPFLLHGTPDPTLEAQWAVFLETQKARFEAGGGLVGGVAIADVSGSMSGVPLQACVALSLFLANLMPEPWRGQMMTFSSNPEWNLIPLDKPLAEQVHSIRTAKWQMSTDFGKAMNLILRTAIENNVPSEQMPSVLYVFTDMQFDQAQGSSHVGRTGPYFAKEAPKKWETVHETVAARFAEAGYQIPFIVYWNLRANGKISYQVSSDTPNTAMLSGFSTSAFDAFCNGDPSSFREARPFEILMKLLDRPVYDRVRQVCSASDEGPLAPYSWTPPPVEVEVEGSDESKTGRRSTSVHESKMDDD